jgi:hypothetical protein
MRQSGYGGKPCLRLQVKRELESRTLRTSRGNVGGIVYGSLERCLATTEARILVIGN